MIKNACYQGRWPNGSLFAIIVAITLRVMNARAALCGLRHSESDVYFVKPSAIGRWPGYWNEWPIGPEPQGVASLPFLLFLKSGQFHRILREKNPSRRCLCGIVVPSATKDKNGSSAFVSETSARLISHFEPEEFALSPALNRCSQPACSTVERHRLAI